MSGSRTSANENPKQPKHSVISDTDSSDDSNSTKTSWVDSFLEQPGSDWFCKIPVTYTNDCFNTYGLKVDPVHAKSALKQLIGTPEETDSDSSFDSDSEDEIERCTEHIYGLVHSRYIFTPEGVNEMMKKYKDGVFGYCPRYNCKNERLIPTALTDKPGVEKVKLFCPSCKQIYEPDAIHGQLDGAYFTKSFAHYLLLELVALGNPRGTINDQSMITSESMSTTRPVLNK